MLTEIYMDLTLYSSPIVYHRVPANEQASAIQTVVQPRVVDRPTTLARNNRSDVILSSKESLYDNVRV